MKKMKNIIGILLCLIFIINTTGSAFANPTTLQQVQTIDSNFLINRTDITEQQTDLFSPLGDAKLIDFFQNNVPIAYAIIIDGVVVEFSEKESPYALYSNLQYTERTWYYDYATYGEVVGNESICFNSNGESNGEIEYGISTMGVLPGVNPQLQNKHNCIVAALSNLIWYWGTHGRSSLIAGRTFENVKNDITTHFNNYGQHFSNNATIEIARIYGKYVSPAVSFSGGAVWSNSSATMIADIDSGYPCLVGFKAGPSSYSNVEGHMTMCFGYYYSGSNLYIVLADGHVPSSVTKLWTSYNDCTIRVRPV